MTGIWEGGGEGGVVKREKADMVDGGRRGMRICTLPQHLAAISPPGDSPSHHVQG